MIINFYIRHVRHQKNSNLSENLSSWKNIFQNEEFFIISIHDHFLYFENRLGRMKGGLVYNSSNQLREATF
jgi:hypothetical protein